MSDHSIFDEDYFMRGVSSGKSLYSNYRWLPELTIPMAEKIILHCGIKRKDKILDFGCARGYLVKALHQLEYDVRGVDVSEWAIKNADKEVQNQCYLLQSDQDWDWIVRQRFDWAIAKDVLEHIEYVDLTINRLMAIVTTGLFVVVPLTKFDSGVKYVIPDYDKDVTHCQRHTLFGWAKMFARPGWRVEISYRVPGVKDNYWKPGWELGNGFLICRRIEK